MKKKGLNFALKCAFCVYCFALGGVLAFAEENSKRMLFINEALKYLGTPYKYASASKTGMDCSGLVYISALNAVNLKLPRSASVIAKQAKQVKPDDLQAGDLVFFNTFGKGVSHVGIYLGGRQFLHSASAGKKTGVITSSLDEEYWSARFLFAGRILSKEESLAGIDVLLNKTSADEENEASPQEKLKTKKDDAAKNNKDRVKEIVAAGISE
ncbi:MAG: glycoside hydrolase [Treponema sp.]|nr:MAG: glycoside hydrolase [Treponema sp.]